MMKNIDAIAAEYALQTSWFIHSLEDITNEESSQSLIGTGNSIKWIAGHIVNTRMTILSLISGFELDESYRAKFGKGSTGQTDESYPSIEEIKTKWLEVSDLLKVALMEVSDEKWNEKPPFQTSIPNETLLGLIAFLAIHESFHIGQISMLRKLLNKPSMKMTRLD